jgi:hypothetical protein
MRKAENPNTPSGEKVIDEGHSDWSQAIGGNDRRQSALSDLGHGRSLAKLMSRRNSKLNRSRRTGTLEIVKGPELWLK